MRYPGDIKFDRYNNARGLTAARQRVRLARVELADALDACNLLTDEALSELFDVVEKLDAKVKATPDGRGDVNGGGWRR